MPEESTLRPTSPENIYCDLGDGEDNLRHIGRTADSQWSCDEDSANLASINVGIYSIATTHIAVLPGSERLTDACPDETTLPVVVIGGGDETIRVFVVEQHRKLRLIQTIAGAHTDSISCVALSASGNLLAAGSMDGTVSLYEVAKTVSAECLLRHRHNTSVENSNPAVPTNDFSERLLEAQAALQSAQVAIDAATRIEAIERRRMSHEDLSRTDDHILEPNNPNPTLTDSFLILKHMQTFSGPPGEIEDLSWSPVGEVLVAADSEGGAWMWHAHRGLVTVLSGHHGRVTAAKFFRVQSSVEAAPSGQKLADEILLVTTGSDGWLNVWDPQSAKARFKAQIVDVPEPVDDDEICTSGIVSIAFHTVEPVVFCGCSDGTLAVVNVRTSRVVHKQKIGTGAIECLACAFPDCHALVGEVLLAIGDSTGNIYLIGPSTFTARHVIKHSSLDESSAVTRISFIPGTTNFVSAGSDGMVKMWDYRDGSLVDSLYSGDGPIHDIKILQGDCSNIDQSVSEQARSVSEYEAAMTTSILAGHEEGVLSLWGMV